MAKGAMDAKLDLEPFELALGQAIESQKQAKRSLERLQALKGNAARASVEDAGSAVKYQTSLFVLPNTNLKMPRS